MALPPLNHPRDLTDEQWALIGPFLPTLAPERPPRVPLEENRTVLNGILWILRTGAPWADLPDRYPSYQTCHRRFQHWIRAGLLRSLLEILAQALTTKAIWICRKRSSTAASRPPSTEALPWARPSAARG